MSKLAMFTMGDIVNRKIHFTKTNTIFDKAEFQDMDEGELLAFHEMLCDVKVMNEEEFVSKYLNIIKKINMQFENEEFANEKAIGYNNAIVSILECINPIYKFDLED
jgi:hypothetical protein